MVGNQWWWEIRYPSLGVVTANELHLPVSDAARPTPTFITLQSADVIHSFWIPQLAGKMDVIPNKINRVWVEPLRTGTYVGQCAEYCGIQHALMLLTVVVHPKDEFDRWVAAQREPAPRRPRGQARPRAVRLARLHQLPHGARHPGQRRLRPRLDAPDEPRAPSPRVRSRTRRETLRAWVDDPEIIKAGARMPAMKLSRDELDAVTAYLTTLR